MEIDNFNFPLEFCSECSSEDPLIYERPRIFDSPLNVIKVTAKCPGCPAKYELELQVEFTVYDRERMNCT